MQEIGFLARAAQMAGLVPHSVVIKDLGAVTPALEIEPDRYFYPASMIKTPLAAAALALAADGELLLDGIFEATDANMTANDKPSPFVPGYRGALREIIERALTHSDNVATNMLFDICKRERATRIVQERFGLRDTAFYRKLSGTEPLISDPQWDGVHRNTHTAGDAARLFELVATRAVPYANLLHETLLRQQFNDKLNAGLRDGDRFAHKTGDTDEVTHDGGVLETANGRSYVVVVYTGLESSDENSARFGTFMQTIRAYL